MKSICVFCGSKVGTNPAHNRLADSLGRFLANRNIRLVYGGAAVGLMGVIAKACKAQGGTVISVIPKKLSDWEGARWDGVDLCIETENLFDRKQVMFRESDAFVAIPGGVGTLDEIFEVMAWSSLQFPEVEEKPLFVLSDTSFFVPLIDMIHHICEEGYAERKGMNINFVSSIKELDMKLQGHGFPSI